jgi:nanoRNase/pAp phosphatase (c-di-AMP/oligoRNAs hydrolase)
VGGQGGGHHAAAGATIPPGTEQQFLEIANRMVREQLHRETLETSPRPDQDAS